MSEDEYEEESSYVIFDPGNSLTSEFLDTITRSSGGCRLIGLEEGQPYLQIGDVIYEGEVDETIGTHLLFEIEERKSATTGLLPLLTSMRSDNDEGPKQRYSVKYACATENVITLESVTMQRKTNEASASHEQEIGTKMESSENDGDDDDDKLDKFLFKKDQGKKRAVQ